MKNNEYKIGTCILCKKVTALKNGICLRCDELRGKELFHRLFEVFEEGDK